MPKWFYQVGGEVIGPVEPRQLKLLADAGRLSPRDPVRREDMSDWYEARCVGGLFVKPVVTDRKAPPSDSSPPAMQATRGNSDAISYRSTNSTEIVDNTAPASTTYAGSVGIGGWLALPAIGVILSPIAVATSIVLQVQLYQEDTGGLLRDLGPAALFVPFQVYVAFEFFDKARQVPGLVTIYLIINIVLSLQLDEPAPIARAILQAAIWIPYFRMSKRVQHTFVN